MTMGMFFWVKKVVPALIVAADGSGDFTDIQSAIDALPDDGGTVLIKCGEYTITAPITIDKSDVSIIGSGRCTKIITTGDIKAIDAEDVDHLLLQKLYIYGSGAGNVDNYGIAFTTVTYSIVENCWVENCGATGIILATNSDNNIVRRNEVSSCSIVGIGTNSGAIISENICNSNLVGILCFQSSKCSVISNTCNSNTLWGISIQNESDENRAENNHCESNGSDGIYLYDNSDNNIVNGNQSILNTGYGINVSDATTTKTIVTNNNCVGNTAGEINDDGTDTQIGHNITS